MLRALTILFLCAVTTLAYAQPVTEQQLGTKIFEALRQNNFQAYKVVMPAQDEYEKEVLSLYDKKNRVSEVPAFIVNNIREFYKSGKLDSLNKFQFEAIIVNGTKLGIADWKDISFLKFHVTYLKDKTLKDPAASAGFWAYLQFSYQKEVYTIGIIGNKLTRGLRASSISLLAKNMDPRMLNAMKRTN
jgi:hypothetical protein